MLQTVTLAGIALNLGVCIFLWTFISGRSHLLGTLLSLEGTMLMLFGIFCWLSGAGMGVPFYILIFLTFMACEGALALSLLVNSVRWWGGDQLSSMTVLQGN